MSFASPPIPSATFSSSLTQTIANPANAQVVTFNTTLVAKGITLASNTKITLPQVGLYCFTFSAVASCGGGSSVRTFGMWLKKNNADVDNTNTIVGIGGNSPNILAATFILQCTTVGDFYELWMSGSDNTCNIPAVPASTGSPSYPASPSIVIAVWQVG